MIQKKLTRLVGLKKDDFDNFLSTGQIQVSPARLIPALKTGDEMALTSIFLSALKLVKEFRDLIFKDLKLSRGGKVYYYTEACFKDISDSRIDGLIIVVTKGKITDAAFFEMKAGKNSLDKSQVQKYLDISKKLKVEKFVTVSNEFVPAPNQSPLDIKAPKAVALFHLSWTYILTKGRLLLFKNDLNIEDKDQVAIMQEVLHYFDHDQSGVLGYSRMKSEWKELADSIRAQKHLKATDSYIKEALLSWNEEEKNLSLLLSRKLGALVKPIGKSNDNLKEDIKTVIKEHVINGGISVKNAVSDIKIKIEFKRRVVSMSIKVIPPATKKNQGKITWIARQLEACNKKTESIFTKLKSNILVEANIKFAKENLKVSLSQMNILPELAKDKKDIQDFKIILFQEFGANLGSQKKFVEQMEVMMLNYYEGIVQHMSSWKQPAPKVITESKKSTIQSIVELSRDRNGNVLNTVPANE